MNSIFNKLSRYVRSNATRQTLIIVGVFSGSLIFLFSAARLLSAAPTQAPPGGNVPPPINMGDPSEAQPQTILGGLIINKNLNVNQNFNLTGQLNAAQGLNAQDLQVPQITVGSQTRPWVYLDHTGAAGYAGGLQWQQQGATEMELFYDSQNDQMHFWDTAGKTPRLTIERTGGVNVNGIVKVGGFIADLPTHSISQVGSGFQGAGFERKSLDFTQVTPTRISDVTITSATTPWRVVFEGNWHDNCNGNGTTQKAPYWEVTSQDPTISIGGNVLTITRNSNGKLEGILNNPTCGNLTTGRGAGFSGTVKIYQQDIFGVAGTESINVKGDILTAGRFRAVGDTSIGGDLRFENITRQIFWPNSSHADSRSWSIIGDQGTNGILQIKSSDASDATIDRTVMTFNRDGNVGIGTAGPSTPLEIRKDGTGAQQILVLSNYQASAADVGAEIDFIGNDASRMAHIVGAMENTPTNGYISFNTRSSGTPGERMRVTSAGNVGIGTTTPGEKLEVIGNIISKGTEWTSRSSAADNQWQSITYGNGLFVAVAKDGSGNRVMTSPDGINWTSRTSAADNSWRSVAYGNGLFVAVADSGSGNRVMTSPDGINWTSRTSAADNGWFSVTYGNGLFVAVAFTNQVMTSPDGINWTSRTSAADRVWFSVTYGNGLFVAVAGPGSSSGNRVMTSPDGINWTSRTSAADRTSLSVTYGNGLFVAVTTAAVMTSPDGINWTSRTSANGAWRSVTYGNGLFVAVSSSGSSNLVMTSPDGINWTSRSSASNNIWRSVTYGNGLFVAVADSGSGNRVMTSGKPELYVTPTNNIYQGGMNIFGNVGIAQTAPGAKLTVNNPTTGGKVGSAGDTIYAYANSTNAAISAEQANAAGWAGFFSGNVKITGNLEFVGDQPGTLTRPNADNQMAFWDGSPASLSGNTNFVYDNSTGRMGIGTANPQSTLHVQGSTATNALLLRLTDSNGTNMFNFESEAAGHARLEIRDTTGAAKIALLGSGDTYFNGGNVGIGTPTPTAKLHVLNGNIMYDDNGTTVQVGKDGGAYGIFGVTDQATGDTPPSTLILSASNNNVTNSGLIEINRSNAYGINLRGGGYASGGDITFSTWNGTANSGAETARMVINHTSGNVDIAGALSSATINTGQGATEVHLMNQNVRTTDSPTFAGLTVNGNVALTGTVDGVDISAKAPDWDTAYSERRQWDGGATNLVAATARTSLGLGALATLNTVSNAEITDGTIANADINASAAIAGTKISPDFGAQNIITTGNVGIGQQSPAARLSINTLGSAGDGVAVSVNSGNSALYAEQQGAGYAGYFSGRTKITGDLELSNGTVLTGLGSAAKEAAEGNKQISLEAGTGLTGGGTVTIGTGGNINLNVGRGNGISLSADAIAIDPDIVPQRTGDQIVAGKWTFGDIATFDKDVTIKGKLTVVDKITNVTVENVTAQGNIVPGVDNFSDLGSPTQRWRDGYFARDLKTKNLRIEDGGITISKSASFANQNRFELIDFPGRTGTLWLRALDDNHKFVRTVLLAEHTGNIGIGSIFPLNQVSPNARLAVDTPGSAGDGIAVSANSANSALYTEQKGSGYAGYFSGNSAFMGNVGIGTSGPSARLHVFGGNTQDKIIAEGKAADNYNTYITAKGTTAGLANTGFRIIKSDNTELARLFMFSSASNPDLMLINTAGGGFRLFTGATENLSVLSNGNVGIGTASPNYKLDVSGQVNASGGLCLNGDCKTTWTDVQPNMNLYLGRGHHQYNWLGAPTDVGRIKDTINAGQGTGVAGGVFWWNPAARQWASGSVPTGAMISFAITGGNKEVALPVSLNDNFGLTTGVLSATEGSFSKDVTIQGNVGIATTTPQAKLHVDGNAIFEKDVIFKGAMAKDVNTYLQRGANQFTWLGAPIDTVVLRTKINAEGIGDGRVAAVSHWIQPTSTTSSSGQSNLGTIQTGEQISISVVLGTKQINLPVIANVQFRINNNGISTKYLSAMNLAGTNFLLNVNAERELVTLATSTFTGNVGIGTLSPTAKLEVAGTLRVVPPPGPGSKTQTSDSDFGGGTATSTTVIGEGTDAKVQLANYPFVNASSSLVDYEGKYIPSPAFADMDNDGDLDMIVGDYYYVSYLENTGTPTSPRWTLRSSNLLNLSRNQILLMSPALGDMDNDGDYDMVVGDYYGKIHYFENTGTTASSTWAYRSSDLLNTNFSGWLHPALVDMDDDGDLDMVVGKRGTVSYFENSGTISSPIWTNRSNNFLNYNTRYYYASPAIIDLDRDGDYDMAVTTKNNKVLYFENIGNAASSTWAYRSNDLLGYDLLGVYPSTTIADINNDGKSDMIIGVTDHVNKIGYVHYFRNDSTNGIRYASSGIFVSSPIDANASDFINLGFNSATPSDTALKFQLRSASTQMGLSSATWYGPTSTTDYYTNPATAINPVNDGKRWFQYKALLETRNQVATPRLHDITIDYITDVGTPFFVDSSGRLGIGTETPASKLHIKAGPTWGSDLSIDSTDLEGGRRWLLVATGGDASEGQGKFLIKDNDANAVRLVIDGNGSVGIGFDRGQNLGTAKFTVNGKVGIGMVNADHSLDVSGIARATQFLETKDNWQAMAPFAGEGDFAWGGGNLIHTGDDYIYAIEGDGKNGFWRYSISNNSWGRRADTPSPIAGGGALVYTGGDYVYAFKGNYSGEFWRHSISNNSWTNMKNAPSGVQYGGSLVYTGGDYIYAFRGSYPNFRNSEFWRYSISENSWETMAPTPAGVYLGASLVYTGGDYIYAFRGDSSRDFLRYSVSQNSWTPMTSVTYSVESGGDLTYAGGDYIYAFTGNGGGGFFRYSISNNSWIALAFLPASPYEGQSLVYTDRGYIYALQGNGKGFWRYSGASDQGLNLANLGIATNKNIELDRDMWIMGGNVGIGTTNPNAKLHIKDGQTWGSDLSIDATGVTNGRIWSLISTGGDASEGQGKFLIKNQSDNNVAMTIDSAGNVGIATTTPQAKLHVDGDLKITDTTNGLVAWISGPLNHAQLPSSVFLAQDPQTNGDGIAFGGLQNRFAAIQYSETALNNRVLQFRFDQPGGLFDFVNGTIRAATTTFMGNVGIQNTDPQHALDVTGAYYSRMVVRGNVNGAVTIDWNEGNTQHITLTGNVTLTFTNGKSGAKYMLVTKRDGTNGRVITWPGDVRWSAAGAPNQTTAANKTDYVGFIYNGVDSKYDGVAWGPNF